jgi:hypothetical protein
MGEFVETSITKASTRTLATPFATAAAMNTVVQEVITDNPFECSAYQVGTTSHQPIEVGKQSFNARIVYLDSDAKTVGTVSARSNTLAGYTGGITAILADTALKTSMGADAVSHDVASDTYSMTLRCHGPNGEIYFVTFTRKTIVITSFADDAIQGRVATWADRVPALA